MSSCGSSIQVCGINIYTYLVSKDHLGVDLRICLFTIQWSIGYIMTFCGTGTDIANNRSAESKDQIPLFKTAKRSDMEYFHDNLF